VKQRAALSPAARRDLADAVRWIARDNPQAAEGLRQEVRAITQLIVEHPFVGSVRPEWAPASFRFLALRSHPYVVAYTEVAGLPRVARLLHSARDLRGLLEG
jgi:toxin ParE1/3/4